MTLADLLDELAGASPPPRVDAAAAWRRGRRDRIRRRVRGGLAAAAVLAVLGLLAPLLPVPVAGPGFARSSDVGVDGHPSRIGRQWLVRDLPDRPGPLAALLQAVEERETHDELDGWYAVRADGHRWRVPGVSGRTDLWPALSPDGRLLALLEGGSGPYVVRDLVTGERRSFPDVREPVGADSGRGVLAGQSPASFSPDGRRLLLPGGLALLDLRSGELRRLARRPGVPAGWAGDDRLVWLVDGGSAEDRRGVDVRAVTTDLDGTVVDQVALEGTGGLGVSQWSGVVDPDGDRLALLTEDAVRRFSLATGAATAPVVREQVRTPCGSQWGPDGTLVVATHAADTGFAARDVTAGATRRFTVVAPSVGARCLVWASDAVSAPARGGGLLGVTDAPRWVWWWREVVLGGVLLVAAVAVGAVRWRPTASVGRRRG